MTAWHVDFTTPEHEAWQTARLTADHEHEATIERPGDPKICDGCGLRRDPVTHAWLTPDDYAALYAERQERRGRFGADRPEGEALARAMNGAGL